MTILGIHEMGHYLTARFYKIRSTLPYFIPVPGYIWAFIRCDRRYQTAKPYLTLALLVLEVLCVTLPFLIWGLAHSTVVPASQVG